MSQKLDKTRQIIGSATPFLRIAQWMLQVAHPIYGLIPADVAMSEYVQPRSQSAQLALNQRTTSNP